MIEHRFLKAMWESHHLGCVVHEREIENTETVEDKSTEA